MSPVKSRIPNPKSQCARCLPLGFGFWVLGFVVCASGIALAQVGMPDPALMHGRAIPAGDLPNGTVTVRVVREAIGNNIVGQDVRVTAGSAQQTAKTDAQGRAEFKGLPSGAEARAQANVDGEALISEPFTVPASGGLRVILVAGLKEAAARKQQQAAAAAAEPPVRGAVVFGPNSRVVMEFRDDALRVFYLLDVVNSARGRVDIGGPLIIDLPTGAGGAGLLEGTTPTASVSGDRVTVTGPFAPGVTSVQVGFQLRYERPDITLRQTWPAAMEQLTVGIEKVGNVSISSPQFSTVGEVGADAGTPFLLASGPAMAAGATLTIELSNLPVHSPVPRYVALSLAAAIVAFGVWLAIGGRTTDESERKRLAQRREKLLSELAGLEKRRGRRGVALAPAEEARRQKIVADLEQIYGELDDSAGPQGGGRDVAA